MGRPRTLSDEQILEAARTCLLSGGPSVSTSAIAARLGVSEAALFKRFGTKERLVTQALAPPPMTWMAALEAGPSEDVALPEQLEALAAEIATWFESLVPRLAVLRALNVAHVIGSDASGEPPPVRARRALERWFGRAMRSGRMRKVPTAPLAEAFLGALEHRVFHRHLAGDSPGEEAGEPLHGTRHLRALIDLFWRGLAPAPGPGPGPTGS